MAKVNAVCVEEEQPVTKNMNKLMRDEIYMFTVFYLNTVIDSLKQTLIFFFFNDPPPTYFYPLPLPAALPTPGEAPATPATPPQQTQTSTPTSSRLEGWRVNDAGVAGMAASPAEARRVP